MHIHNTSFARFFFYNFCSILKYKIVILRTLRRRTVFKNFPSKLSFIFLELFEKMSKKVLRMHSMSRVVNTWSLCSFRPKGISSFAFRTLCIAPFFFNYRRISADLLAREATNTLKLKTVSKFFVYKN